MTHRIGIVVFDEMTLLDAGGPAEVFHLADRAGGDYDLQFIAPGGGSVRSSSGIEMGGCLPPEAAERIDTLLVAGGETLVDRPIDPELLAAVDDLATHADRVASVCTGAFVLAELGYLTDRRATTHWRHAGELARRYPRIRVEPDVIHLRDGRYLTSAGISAGIDLALAIVEEDLGSAAARSIAQELVVFMQRPGGQTQFSTALHRLPDHDDPLRPLMESVAADPAGPHTVASMA